MKKLVLGYGLIGGIILVTWMTISTQFMNTDQPNFKLLEIIGYTTMVVALSTIFLGIKKWRDQELGGTISFGEAFKVGILITIVASALYVIGWMVLSNTLVKDFGDQYYEHYVETLRSSGMDETELQQKIAYFEKNKELYKNPFFKIGITFLEIFPIGLVITLISAFVLKKSQL